MPKQIYFFVLLLLVLLSSCVPTKRITYLQEGLQQQDSLITVTQQQSPYRIQVNDVLSIRLKALDQQLVSFFNLTNDGGGSTSLGEGYYYDGFAVNPHGNIRVPTLGEINVLGHTTDEIRLKIETLLLKDYIKENADLFVTVKLAGIRYTISGEVGGAGVKTELVERLSLMDAIANAGGVPETGDLTDIKIIRQYPGGQRVHSIDLTTLAAMNSPYYYVQPNDLIVVNPLPQKALGIATTGLGSFTTIASVIATFSTILLLFTR